jgi:hypothetical protein
MGSSGEPVDEEAADRLGREGRGEEEKRRRGAHEAVFRMHCVQ